MSNPHQKPKSPSNERRLAGVVAFFEGPHALLEAMEKVKSARYQHYDAFTPYPVHGMDAAQGLKSSPIPYVTFVAGITGTAIAFLFQYWTSAVDWPLIVGGKPLNSWPAFVPIMFELTVLFAGISTVAALILFCGLPNIKRKIYDPGITRDRFALVIESSIPAEEDDETSLKKAAQYKAFQEAEVQQFLKQLGATEVRSVYSEGWF